MKSFSPQAKTLLFAFLLLALFFVYGGLFYPHSADLPSGGSLEEPSSAHWLGTDDLGVDLYAQLSAGFFSSMAVGLAAAAFAFLLGGLAGVLAGLSSGTADAFLSFLIQLFLSLPQLPVMVVIGAFFGQSAWNIILIVSLFSWAPIAKVLRARVRQIRGRPLSAAGQKLRGPGGIPCFRPICSGSCCRFYRQRPFGGGQCRLCRKPRWPIWGFRIRFPDPGGF